MGVTPPSGLENAAHTRTREPLPAAARAGGSASWHAFVPCVLCASVTSAGGDAVGGARG